jgi:hypothetical protein
MAVVGPAVTRRTCSESKSSSVGETRTGQVPPRTAGVALPVPLRYARPRSSPRGDSRKVCRHQLRPEVATADPPRICSSCFIVLHQRKGSPRRDSNPRPSDYESVPSLPTGPAQTHPGCSGTGLISSDAVPWCLVSAPGLPQWLPTRAYTPASMRCRITSSIRSRSDARRAASSTRLPRRRGISPGIEVRTYPDALPLDLVVILALQPQPWD